MHPIIHHCPVCQHTLHATRLQCKQCHTIIENDFELSNFATLSKEQLHFVEIFLANRGNIKEVEKSLGISYPTVRAKLNDIIQALGYKQKIAEEHQKQEIIDMLHSGEISAEEAIEQLKVDADQ